MTELEKLGQALAAVNRGYVPSSEFISTPPGVVTSAEEMTYGRLGMVIRFKKIPVATRWDMVRETLRMRDAAISHDQTKSPRAAFEARREFVKMAEWANMILDSLNAGVTITPID